MATKTIDGFLLCTKYSWEKEPTFGISSCAVSNEYTVTVKPITVEVEVPDHFDPRDLQVAALRQQQKTVQAEAQAQVTALESKIQSLLAIEHKPE